MKQQTGTYQSSNNEIIKYWETRVGAMIVNPQGEISIQLNDVESPCSAKDVSAGLRIIEWKEEE